MKKKTRKQIDAEIALQRQAKMDLELQSTTVKDAVRRVFSNIHTQQDVLMVGQKIAEFKESDLMPIITAAVEYVINCELDEDKKSKLGVNSDESLGIQKGARRVLTSILGLERSSIIINNQIEQRKKQEEQDEDDKVIDPEDLMPIKRTGGQGI